MKTKEDHIKELNSKCDGYLTRNEGELVKEVLESYAKQQAIDFLNFASRIAWYDTDVYLWNLYDETADPFRLSNEEMYQLLIQEQNNL